jgi:hypothetical protein
MQRINRKIVKHERKALIFEMPLLETIFSPPPGKIFSAIAFSSLINEIIIS